MVAAVIQGCVIVVQFARGKLSFLKSWPEFLWIDYHIEGTQPRPQRNPAGLAGASVSKPGSAGPTI
jgi:hypothetical protein